MARLKYILVFILIAAGLAGAANMRLSLREESGRTVFERNSVYNVVLQVAPVGATALGAIGEIYIEYDKTVFDSIAVFKTDYYQLPSSIWESEKVSFNHRYASGPSKTCIEYAKTDNNGTFWNISSTQSIYVVACRVKTNAPTGSTGISFIYSPDNSKTKMIKSDGSVIPLTVQNLNLQIDLDRTSPVTQINYPGGIFKTVPLLKLSPNENALVHYLVIGGSNIWEEQTVSANIWTNTISLPSNPGQVKYSTIQFYSEDLAQDKTHNEEDVRAYLFTVDQETPVINNIQVPATAVPIGSIAEVYFDIFDQVGISQEDVLIGGKPAYRYSGNGTGRYIYRRQIDGSENPSGTLSITVADTAANITTDNTRQVKLDFAGPLFTDIRTDPVTAQVKQEIVVSFRSSETLKQNPDVKVGANTASFISEQNLQYRYRCAVTANGWYIDLVYLPDRSSPYTERNLPVKYSSVRPLNTDIYFRIGDSESAISTWNMQIYVNGINVYQNGSFRNGYKGRIFYIGNVPNVVCIPDRNFQSNSRVTVNIRVADINQNLLNETYYFSTGTTADILAPTVENVFPVRNSADAERDTPIYFVINDHSGCGVAIDRLNLTLTETATVNVAPEIKKYLVDDPKKKPVAITANRVIVNGVFQPGFHGTIVPDIEGNLQVSIIPEQKFMVANKIDCTAVFEDLAITANRVTENWSFTIKHERSAEAYVGRKPLAWPSIYNPLNSAGTKQLLTFVLAEPGDTAVRLYDLSGDMVWEFKFEAVAGYQAVPWDGREAFGRVVGNGVYVWYVVQNKKVVARGTSIIMKE